MTREQELHRLFWELNSLHFGGVLPSIDLRFSNRLKSTGGQYFKKPKRYIQISARYFEFENPWNEIRDTLGHEMVHYWLDFLGRPCGHTPQFRNKIKECGFHRYSGLSPARAKYVYSCKACGLRYYRRRRGLWSCGPCSGDRFNPKYVLDFLGHTAKVDPTPRTML